MATTLQTIIDIARRSLIETTASFWTDAELVAITNRGIRDLRRAINDTYQDYFITIDATNVSLAASGVALTGVPADVGVVRGIEPRVLTDFPRLKFRPKDYNHADMQSARAADSFDPTQGGIVWYAITGAGGPVAAPTIHVAPSLTTAVPLRLIYVPSATELVAANDNPIPGESDQALVAWTIAFARAKEREDRAPDPSWLAVYGTEKQGILVSLTPRQTDEEEVAEAIFEQWWQ